MPKSLRFIILAFAVLSSACNGQLTGSTAQPPTPGPATATQTTPVPRPDSTATANATVEATVLAEQTTVAPPGLRIVFVREGNLWSWTEASGNVMLTNTGDMSTARLSEDGQLLAFIRGREVWSIRMDGTDPRLLVTLTEEGGALWFPPGGSLLAISSSDHIDVVDLVHETSTTVFTYPAIPDDYYPEVVWSPDGSSFKTILPATSDKGQAEFLFVFTNGTVATLGKFSMVSPTESQPFISPDGGYVIHVARLSSGQESLYLMDSSGARKPYGKPAKSVRAFGWLPDSKSFIFAQEDPQQALLGNVMKSEPMEVDLADYHVIRWVDEAKFLALQGNNLYFGDMDGGKSLIAEGIFDFDFAKE